MSRHTAKTPAASRRRSAKTAADPQLPNDAEPGDTGSAAADEPAANGLYGGCFDPADQAALSSAIAAGLDEETALMRVLIRRALLEGRPAQQVAYLISVLANLVKTQHVLAGKSAKQLDEALANALDAIAAEMGVKL